ncbi:MAG: hypothetical protein FWC95_05635 [Defluviitaleaceae bacterium]|nr:hypothetical protein [Defluviitaleaceae bacterium]
MNKFQTPIIIFSTIIILFLSLFVFPVTGYIILYPWADWSISILILSISFIFIWIILLFIAAKTKSALLFRIYRYYWLVLICSIVLFAFNNAFVDDVFTFFLFILFVIPFYGITPIFNDNLTILYIFIPMIMFLAGIFIKRKFMN